MNRDPEQPLDEPEEAITFETSYDEIRQEQIDDRAKALNDELIRIARSQK